jgi:hypothetical protein
MRQYERVVRFLPGGAFETEDRFDTCRSATCGAKGTVTFRGSAYVNDALTEESNWGRACRHPSATCAWLDSESSSGPDTAKRAIGQYPALLFFDGAPFESDGEGLVCRYHRIK